ncbi:MAG: FHA domain-containing protein [Planctomycetes bacterium]|nr:FHA domain-containing protein [Planctomycetota bacterium]
MQVNLVFLKKDGTTSSFELPSTVTFIGRRQDCDFCIPLMVVSRRHCEISQDFGKISARDLRSRNGTLVNGQPIEETQLKAGDVLKIGPIEFVVQIDGVPESFEEYLSEREVQPEVSTDEQPEVSTAEQSEDENFEEVMQDFSDIDLGKSRTELASDFSESFDFDEDFDL